MEGVEYAPRWTSGLLPARRAPGGRGVAACPLAPLAALDQRGVRGLPSKFRKRAPLSLLSPDLPLPSRAETRRPGQRPNGERTEPLGLVGERAGFCWKARKGCDADIGQRARSRSSTHAGVRTPGPHVAARGWR